MFSSSRAKPSSSPSSYASQWGYRPPTTTAAYHNPRPAAAWGSPLSSFPQPPVTQLYPPPPAHGSPYVPGHRAGGFSVLSPPSAPQQQPHAAAAGGGEDFRVLAARSKARRDEMAAPRSPRRRQLYDAEDDGTQAVTARVGIGQLDMELQLERDKERPPPPRQIEPSRSVQALPPPPHVPNFTPTEPEPQTPTPPEPADPPQPMPQPPQPPQQADPPENPPPQSPQPPQQADPPENPPPQQQPEQPPPSEAAKSLSKELLFLAMGNTRGGVYEGKLARIVQEIKAVTKLQKNFRRVKALRKRRLEDAAAVKIQATARGHLARQGLERDRKALSKMQAMIRGSIYRRSAKTVPVPEHLKTIPAPEPEKKKMANTAAEILKQYSSIQDMRSDDADLWG